MGSVSFWQVERASHAPPALGGAPLREERTADVVVIGAGITGTATALWLAREKARVVVLEAREVAASASGRNGGFLLAGTAGTYAAAIERYGHPRAQRIWAFSSSNHQFARQLIEEMEWRGWDCGYQQSGSMRIARTEAELEEIWESVRRLLEDGWEASQIDVDELPERLRGTYLGGSFHAVDGEAQPAHFVRGLARLAQAAGATFYEGSPVTTVEEHADQVVVRTAEGAVRTQRVVLATNARLPELLGQLGANWLGEAITPIRGQMLATAPLDEELFTWPCYADQGYQYWRQLSDGRLVVGGWRNTSFATEATADETPAAPVQDALERFVRETLKLSAARAPISQRWAGTMAFSADALPLVGRIPGTQRCFVAGAYTGHGNAYAIASAQVITDLVRGQHHPDADLFDPARLHPDLV
ncbi:MAG TPA: FAD-dependent oxidoreductase [Ktedonobacterales bacterium]|nr:FAD-dependent oxidoreductase [Ktedonobacterales bacterium]